jgi:hypothetical protein
MSLPIVTLSVLAASLSGADMSTTSLPQNLEANRIGIEQCGTKTQLEAKQGNLIEVAQRGTENAFTYSMGKQADELHERVAASKPVEDLIYAVQPQAERSEFTSLAVYQDQDQSKEAPMLATQPQSERTEASTLAHKDGGIQNEQWTAFASPERSERIAEMGNLA